MALHKPELPLSGQHSLPDGYATISRCRRCGIVIGFGDRCDLCIDPRVPTTTLRGSTGAVTTANGRRRSTSSSSRATTTKPSSSSLRLIDATVAEATLRGVPPFERHFRRLAQIARRRGDTKLEAQIAARYEDCVRQARGAGEHDGIGRAESLAERRFDDALEVDLGEMRVDRRESNVDLVAERHARAVDGDDHRRVAHEHGRTLTAANTIEVDDSSVEDRSLPPSEHQRLRQVDDGALDASGTVRPLRHHVRERNERRAQVIAHLVVLEQCEEDLVRVAIGEPA